MRTLVTLMLGSLCSLALAAQDSAVDTLPIDNLRERLEALEPTDPVAYFQLGEEVAEEFETPEELELARTLFVLAFHLDRDQAGTIAPSCAIALAQLQGIGQDRDWLLSLTHALDQRYAAPDWRGALPSVGSDHDAYQAAVAVGRVRSGHGREATALLQDPDVMAMILRYEPLLSPANQPGSADWLMREARKWPCPECGFNRVSRAIDASNSGYVKCRVCSGNPGPEITQEELIAQLRFEARMLNGVQRSWAAQVIADAGAPLRDPTPQDLAPILGIDHRKSLWREGNWIAPDRELSPPEPDAPAIPAVEEEEGDISTSDSATSA